jgi:hypothetical protein
VQSSSFKRNCHSDRSEVERPAVSLPVLPQNRHPCAAQIYRVIQRSVARSRRACPERSRRNLGGAYLAQAVRSFSTTQPAPGYEDIRIAVASDKQPKGWRRAKKLNLIGTINPEFKDLAQTWGWKMITVHEKMYP